MRRFVALLRGVLPSFPLREDFNELKYTLLFSEIRVKYCLNIYFCIDCRTEYLSY